ncbi:MAG: hypothetical protein FJX75_23565 [Armatimonadetes bacterium]|nr:hypothetical protein [Armatimonadota bacterium]
MEFRFKLKGKHRRATRERVIEALRNVLPEPRTMYMVNVEGTAYPLKQAFCLAFGVGRTDVGTRDAQRIMERLEFEVTRGPAVGRRRESSAATGSQEQRRMPRHGTEEPWWSWEELEIPKIVLRWSYAERWVDIAGIGEYADEVYLPPSEPGVYRVRQSSDQPLLYIGKSKNLRRRVVDGLVKGMIVHAAGERIRESEDVRELVIRWAVTDRPAAAEEELLRQHVKLWGALPKYVEHE